MLRAWAKIDSCGRAGPRAPKSSERRRTRPLKTKAEHFRWCVVGRPGLRVGRSWAFGSSTENVGAMEMSRLNAILR